MERDEGTLQEACVRDARSVLPQFQMKGVLWGQVVQGSSFQTRLQPARHCDYDLVTTAFG